MRETVAEASSDSVVEQTPGPADHAVGALADAIHRLGRGPARIVWRLAWQPAFRTMLSVAAVGVVVYRLSVWLAAASALLPG